MNFAASDLMCSVKIVQCHGKYFGVFQSEDGVTTYFSVKGDIDFSGPGGEESRK